MNFQLQWVLSEEFGDEEQRSVLDEFGPRSEVHSFAAVSSLLEFHAAMSCRCCSDLRLFRNAPHCDLFFQTCHS